MATIQEQININVRWARNANHRLVKLYKAEFRNWEAIHSELECRVGLMKLARLLKKELLEKT